MTEAHFQEQIIALARLEGWLIMHTRPARTATGRIITPIQGDPGFPDLVLARQGRIIFAELKSTRGRLSDDQTRWLDELLGAEGDTNPTIRVWRENNPDDWTDIVTLLTTKEPDR